MCSHHFSKLLPAFLFFFLSCVQGNILRAVGDSQAVFVNDHNLGKNLLNDHAVTLSSSVAACCRQVTI